eukprot:scaffold94541_cov69-Phaeocystis_antarctica.AAC.6
MPARSVLSADSSSNCSPNCCWRWSGSFTPRVSRPLRGRKYRDTVRIARSSLSAGHVGRSTTKSKSDGASLTHGVGRSSSAPTLTSPFRRKRGRLWIRPAAGTSYSTAARRRYSLSSMQKYRPRSRNRMTCRPAARPPQPISR